MNGFSWNYPRMAAHRGAGKFAPENTLAAIRSGFGFGYRMIEVDVKLSGDGVAFLLHDDTLDRTTSGSGRADALIWHELSRLDAGAWHSSAYAGEPIPTLAALARYCRANDLAVNLEIKPTPGRERETGAAVALDAQTLWKGAALPPLLSSFSEAAMLAAREVAPELPRAFLTETLPADWQAQCEKIGAVAIDPAHAELTEANVAAMKRAGLRVTTWTVNDAARVKQLLDWGVDCVMTDCVDTIRPIS